MEFHEREYNVYLVLGNPAAPPPWVHSTWVEVSRALDPLMKVARDRPAVRSSQVGPPKERLISFGRVGWNDKGAEKWSHKEDGQLLSGAQAHFMTSEVWAPSWTTCERDRLAPDIYFAMRNESNFGAPTQENKALSFSSACILAVASDLGPERAGQARSSAESIATIIRAVGRAHCARPWGCPTLDGRYYSDAINDLVIIGGIFKSGPRPAVPVSPSMLNGAWVSF